MRYQITRFGLKHHPKIALAPILGSENRPGKGRGANFRIGSQYAHQLQLLGYKITDSTASELQQVVFIEGV